MDLSAISSCPVDRTPTAAGVAFQLVVRIGPHWPIALRFLLAPRCSLTRVRRWPARC